MILYIVLYLLGGVLTWVGYLWLIRDQEILKGDDLTLLFPMLIIWPFTIIAFALISIDMNCIRNPFFKKKDSK